MQKALAPPTFNVGSIWTPTCRMGIEVLIAIMAFETIVPTYFKNNFVVWREQYNIHIHITSSNWVCTLDGAGNKLDFIWNYINMFIMVAKKIQLYKLGWSIVNDIHKIERMTTNE